MGRGPLTHPVCATWGPEPLSDAFCGSHLQRAAAQRRVAIKQLIMDGSVVVGVGNIYASEALFHAGIRPQTLCRRISRARLDALADAIKAVLARAIERGGTTLRDFVNESGGPATSPRNCSSTGVPANPADAARHRSGPCRSASAPAPTAPDASTDLAVQACAHCARQKKPWTAWLCSTGPGL